MASVHILVHGKALCYFLFEKVPGEWPGNHTWVGFDQRADANCVQCLDRVNGKGEIVPGFSIDWMVRGIHYGYDKFLEKHGGGQNQLRTPYLSQPRALKPGDRLATGEQILSPSREGFNGEVFIHLASHLPEGIWLGVPSRIAIALLSEEAPEELRKFED